MNRIHGWCLQDRDVDAYLLFGFGADQLRGGMKVPIDGEVAWLTEAGRKSYWRGTLTFLHHEMSAA